MELNGTWKLYYYKNGTVDITHPSRLAQSGVPCIDAVVPGNTQLDLCRTGVLPHDIFKGDSILKAEEYETYDWWYETEFIPAEPESDENVVLHFGAVDCFAEYYLNGQHIGSSNNMLIEQEFEIGEYLIYGKKNVLHVYIKSPAAAVADIPVEPGVNRYSWHMFAMLDTVCRKAPHTFGWDIMPRAVASGIWRDVTLEYRPKYGFNYLYWVTHQADESNAQIRLYYDSKVPLDFVLSNMRMVVEGACGESKFRHECVVAGRSNMIMFNIPTPKLWWPRNYGEANLYDITVTAYSTDGEKLFYEKIRRGIRTVKLDRTDIITEKGGRFRFIINGVPVMAVGSNWVPMDAFHSRDKERYKKALEMAVDLNCNILRCWGGNVYEDHEFFDFCDENGIMVWQDFAMACHFYPQTRVFYDMITAEAESIVKKLRDHASLVAWSGDNEVDQAVFGLGGDPSMNRITREILPSVLERLDPMTAYLPSSAYVSDEIYKLRSADAENTAFPELHLWGVRDYHKNPCYLTPRACFISETGYHGCMSVESLKRAVDDEFLWPYKDNRQWILRSSDQKGNPARVMLMETQIRNMFGTVPDNIEDFSEASQICQAEADKFFIERVRSRMDRMGGVIWWNLIDGWPQISDAVVDYFYDKKLAYYFIKRSSRQFIVMMGENESAGGYPIICANSSRKPVSGKLTVTDAETDRVMFEGDFTAEPNGNTRLGRTPVPYSGKGMMILRWETGEGTFFNSYLYGTPGFDLSLYKKWLSKLEAMEKQ